jgi:hypothetical protein
VSVILRRRKGRDEAASLPSPKRAIVLVRLRSNAGGSAEFRSCRNLRFCAFSDPKVRLVLVLVAILITAFALRAQAAPPMRTHFADIGAAPHTFPFFFS